jgi:hypothetical protein
MERSIQEVARLSGHRTTMAPERPTDKLEMRDELRSCVRAELGDEPPSHVE